MARAGVFGRAAPKRQQKLSASLCDADRTCWRQRGVHFNLFIYIFKEARGLWTQLTVRLIVLHWFLTWNQHRCWNHTRSQPWGRPWKLFHEMERKQACHSFLWKCHWESFTLSSLRSHMFAVLSVKLKPRSVACSCLRTPSNGRND